MLAKPSRNAQYGVKRRVLPARQQSTDEAFKEPEMSKTAAWFHRQPATINGYSHVL